MKRNAFYLKTNLSFKSAVELSSLSLCQTKEISLALGIKDSRHSVTMKISFKSVGSRKFKSSKKSTESLQDCQVLLPSPKTTSSSSGVNSVNTASTFQKGSTKILSKSRFHLSTVNWAINLVYF